MKREWYSIEMKADQPAVISIFGAIGSTWDGDGVTAKEFCNDLRKIDAKEITLFINSPGGSLFDGSAMYNALRAHGAEITGKVLGIAASAASLVFMAAHKREMPKTAMLMVHNASSGGWGTAVELHTLASVLEQIDKSVHNAYIDRTGKTADEIKALLGKDTWMSAEEAVENGFADTVTDDALVTAQFDTDALPESIQVLLGSAPKDQARPPLATAQAAALAEQIETAAVKAGLGEHAGLFALACATLPEAQSAIDNAREIVALCKLAKLPDAAVPLIAAKTPLAEARKKVQDMRAEADETLVTRTAARGGSPDGKSTAPEGLSVTNVYAKRQSAIGAF